MQNFSDLGASAPVAAALARRGFHESFPVQTMVLPDALAGHDVLARSRTGSGKTLAFAVPIVERIDRSARQPSALVLVPTRELATQVVAEFTDVARAKGLRVASVYGGVGIRAQADRAARAHVLVATPGRMEDLANRRLVSLDGIRILILDEADRMLDMGFQPQVDRIVRRLPQGRQTMFFSATLDGAVGHLARSYTHDARRHEVAAPRQTVDEANHRFVPVVMGERLDHLVRMIEEERGRRLVFVRTKRGADRLVQRLRGRGVRAAAMHGDLSQPVRERTLARFDRGDLDTLVATDVAARGLDVDNITHVVNYDAPEDDKAYVHRVGRTARAGRAGTGITFVLPAQRGDMSRIASRLKLETEFTEEGMEISPPRVVFSSSKGRRSVMGRRRR